MIFKTLVAVSILLNGVVIHLEWKRIENLEQWVMHLIKQADRKDEPTISKMEQVEDEPQTEEHCETCKHWEYDAKYKWWHCPLQDNGMYECHYEPRKLTAVEDEPTSSKMEQVDKDINVRSKDDPQTDDFFREPTEEEMKAVREYIDSISVPTGVNVFDLMDEPQTEYERASEQREHDILYEPTYDLDNGSM